MADCLFCLGHYAVVGGNNKDCDVSYLCAPCPHSCKCLVAWGVKECNLPVVVVYLIGSNVLRDASGFAIDHVGLSDGVKQCGFAVVHMPKDCNDGRTVFEHFGVVVVG